MPLGHSASAVKTCLSVGTFTVGHHVLRILPLVKDPNHDASSISKRREAVLVRISPLYCMTGEKSLFPHTQKFYLLFKIFSALFFFKIYFYYMCWNVYHMCAGTDQGQERASSL